MVEDRSEDGCWIARCVARLIELDPQLDPALAQPIVEDMCTRARWRRMVPEEAAQTVFDFGSRNAGSAGN